jgi:hypothetical protein
VLLLDGWRGELYGAITIGASRTAVNAAGTGSHSRDVAIEIYLKRTNYKPLWKFVNAGNRATEIIRRKRIGAARNRKFLARNHKTDQPGAQAAPILAIAISVAVPQMASQPQFG